MNILLIEDSTGMAVQTQLESVPGEIAVDHIVKTEEILRNIKPDQLGPGKAIVSLNGGRAEILPDSRGEFRLIIYAKSKADYLELRRQCFSELGITTVSTAT